jgi:hypothetical protein
VGTPSRKYQISVRWETFSTQWEWP